MAGYENANLEAAQLQAQVAQWAADNAYRQAMLQFQDRQLALQAAEQAAQLVFQGDANALQAAGLLNQSDLARVGQAMEAINTVGNWALATNDQKLGALQFMDSSQRARLGMGLDAGNSLNQDALGRLGLGGDFANSINQDALARLGIGADVLANMSQDEIARLGLGLQAGGMIADDDRARGALGLDAARAASQEGLSAMGLAASLRGPSNAFQQQAVMQGLNANGLTRAVDAIAGKYDVAGWQAPQAAPEAASLGTLARDMGAAGGQSAGMAPGDLMAQLADRYANTPGQGQGMIGDVYGRSGEPGRSYEMMEGLYGRSKQAGEGTGMLRDLYSRAGEEGPGTGTIWDVIRGASSNPYEGAGWDIYNSDPTREAREGMQQIADWRMQNGLPGDEYAKWVADNWVNGTSPAKGYIDRLGQYRPGGGSGSAAPWPSGPGQVSADNRTNSALDHIWQSRPDLQRVYGQGGWFDVSTPEGQRQAVQDWLKNTPEGVGTAEQYAGKLGWTAPTGEGGNVNNNWQSPWGGGTVQGGPARGYQAPAAAPYQGEQRANSAPIGVWSPYGTTQSQPGQAGTTNRQAAGSNTDQHMYPVGVVPPGQQPTPQPGSANLPSGSRLGPMPGQQPGRGTPWVGADGRWNGGFMGGQPANPPVWGGTPEGGMPGQQPGRGMPTTNPQGRWNGGYMGGQPANQSRGTWTAPEARSQASYQAQQNAPYSTNQGAYARALPAMNKVVGRNWMQAPNSTRQFMQSAYESAGYSPDDLNDTIKRGLPQFKAPRYGTVR
jgi:hypothetical protein